jgi:hypothetical protein
LTSFHQTSMADGFAGTIRSSMSCRQSTCMNCKCEKLCICLKTNSVVFERSFHPLEERL